MADFIAEAIRNRIGQPQNDCDRAVLAVVDKCEQTRAETADVPGGAGRYFADEFEGVVARTLGINH